VRERGLQPGQSMEIAGYTLTYQSIGATKGANSVDTRAVVDVTRGGSHLTTLHPGKNFYPVAPGGPQTSNEVSIYHDPRSLGDVFLIADQVDKNGTLFLKALVKPLVNLIWAAGFLFVFGSLVALWPDAVEQRRCSAPCSRSARSSSSRGRFCGSPPRRATGSTSRASSSGGGSSSSRSATARSRR
jgi:cytochrome c-type biogenesis protein CcmF